MLRVHILIRTSLEFSEASDPTVDFMTFYK